MNTLPSDATGALNPEELAASLKDLAARILDEARHQGATGAEVAAGDSTGLVVAVRRGELETVEFTNDRGFGITVYMGARKGNASTTDAGPDAIRETVRAALNIAKYTEEDSCNGLAEASLMARELPDLDLHHPWDVDVSSATERALEAEAAGLAFDHRIVNTEGARVATGRGCHVYGNSHGFLEAGWGTRHSTSCALIAADDNGMKPEDWYTVSRDPADLEDPVEVGREAARRAVGRLGCRPVETGSYPVLFAPPVAAGLISHLLSAIGGRALYRRESYLVDSLHRQVAADGITLREEPHRPKGLASAAYDGDGVATRAKSFIEKGVVASYILDSYSGRRLGMTTTGNAGGYFNLDVVADVRPVAELMREMDTGLLVTSLMGQGVNLVTGDYSRGAGGVWIAGGEPSHPVDEVTIAANLDDVFKGIVACGDDIDRRGNIRSGSLLVREMTVAN
ncbi:MAG: metalloprotease PmbA [Gammaproteobacteria bacterium]|nr:metalloprotease PmbA [Gammaproteobacteria bacterium]